MTCCRSPSVTSQKMWNMLRVSVSMTSTCLWVVNWTPWMRFQLVTYSVCVPVVLSDMVFMGRELDALDEVPAGNTLGVSW